VPSGVQHQKFYLQAVVESNWQIENPRYRFMKLQISSSPKSEAFISVHQYSSVVNSKKRSLIFVDSHQWLKNPQYRLTEL
jgi:hypothetical protein